MIKLIALLLFYFLILLLALFSLAMIYALLRFGKSKVLGLILSAFYLVLMFSLYAAALANFYKIPFPRI